VTSASGSDSDSRSDASRNAPAHADGAARVTATRRIAVERGRVALGDSAKDLVRSLARSSLAIETRSGCSAAGLATTTASAARRDRIAGPGPGRARASRRAEPRSAPRFAQVMRRSPPRPRATHSSAPQCPSRLDLDRPAPWPAACSSVRLLWLARVYFTVDRAVGTADSPSSPASAGEMRRGTPGNGTEPARADRAHRRPLRRSPRATGSPRSATASAGCSR